MRQAAQASRASPFGGWLPQSFPHYCSKRGRKKGAGGRWIAQAFSPRDGALDPTHSHLVRRIGVLNGVSKERETGVAVEDSTRLLPLLEKINERESVECTQRVDTAL